MDISLVCAGKEGDGRRGKEGEVKGGRKVTGVENGRFRIGKS